MTPRRSANRNQGYILRLEEMWDAHKFDLYYRNTEQEEKRREEILEMFRRLGEVAKRGIDPPRSPPWEK